MVGIQKVYVLRPHEDRWRDAKKSTKIIVQSTHLKKHHYYFNYLGTAGVEKWDLAPS
jgi:hypothetical protein